MRLGNICQISGKVARVTGTQRAVEHAGRDDELAYQEMLKGLELKRDMETILVGTNQAKNAGNDTTARKTAVACCPGSSPTPSKGTAGGAADPATADGAGTRTDGTQRAFTEANLKTVLQSIWTNGGKPDMIMTGAFNKQVFSTFTGRASPIEERQGQEDHRIGRRLRERLRHAQGGAEPLPARARRSGAADGDVGGRLPQRAPHGVRAARQDRRQRLAATCSPNTRSSRATRNHPAACSTHHVVTNSLHPSRRAPGRSSG